MLEQNELKPSDVIAEQVRHYIIGQCMGEGGFGRVFEAWDKKLCRNVAIKQLKQSGTGNLLKEAQLAASLQHPAFVKIFAIEEEPDSQSIVMELIKGQNLIEVKGQARFEQTKIWDIAHQIADAMADAHEAGLVHGDLKPSNIMLDDKGRVRILDFGLAKISDPQLTRTSTGVDPQGTVRYMAPELLNGKTTSVQTDIYALGVILYELLAGQSIFPDSHGIALASTILQTTSKSWEFPASISPKASRLIIAMTERNPQQRLQSMQEVAELLAKVQQGVAMVLPPAIAAVEVPRKSFFGKALLRSKKALVTLAVLCVGIGVWHAFPYMENYLTPLKPYSESLSMQRGLDALKQFDRPGSLDLATKEFTTILEHDPKNAAGVAGLSLTFAARFTHEGNEKAWLEKANASAQQALRMNASLAISQVAMGKVNSLKGNNESALTYFEKALQLDPIDNFAWQQLIKTLVDLQRWPIAQEKIDQAIIRFPKDRVFLDFLGIKHLKTGENVAAEAAFRRSIVLQPDSAYAYANLSTLLLRQNRLEDSLNILQQGLKIRPNALLYQNLGNVFFLQKNYIASVESFKKAVHPLSGDPNKYEGWANLGDALLWLPNQKTESRQAYEKAIQLLAPILASDASNETSISRMALYSARVGDKNVSQEMVNRTMMLVSKSPDVWFRIGLTNELNQKRIPAIQAFKRAMHLGFPLSLIEAEPDLVELRKDVNFINNQ